MLVAILEEEAKPHGRFCTRIQRDMEEIPFTKILDLIKKGDPVRCHSKIITGNLDIGMLDLPKENGQIIITSIIEIVDSRICGNVSFFNAMFKNDLDEGVDFTKTIFYGHANFNKASFCKGAEFIESQFTKKANFGDARFYYSVFTEAVFDGYADFEDTKFNNHTIFDGAQFNNYANFVKSRFNEVASFHWVRFNDYANFSKAKFKNKANFDRVRFKDNADFRGTIFENDFSLRESSFERVQVSWEDIKDHLMYDHTIYLSLINNFKNLGSFNDADNCYFQYRKFVQKSKRWYSSSNKCIDLLDKIHEEIASYLRLIYADLKWICLTYLSSICQFNWSKLYDLISEVTCGYGVRIMPIFLWMIGLCLIFACAYCAFNGIEAAVTSEPTSKAASSGDISILDSLYFSIMAITGKPPIGFIPIGGWKYIVMVESFFGYMLMALFVFVIIRKLIR